MLRASKDNLLWKSLYWGFFFALEYGSMANGVENSHFSTWPLLNGIRWKDFYYFFWNCRRVWWPVKLTLSYNFIFSLFLYIPLWLKISAGPDISETSANLSSRQLYLKAYKFWLNLFFPKQKKQNKNKKLQKKQWNTYARLQVLEAEARALIFAIGRLWLVGLVGQKMVVST